MLRNGCRRCHPVTRATLSLGFLSCCKAENKTLSDGGDSLTNGANYLFTLARTHIHVLHLVAIVAC